MSNKAKEARDELLMFLKTKDIETAADIIRAKVMDFPVALGVAALSYCYYMANELIKDSPSEAKRLNKQAIAVGKELALAEAIAVRREAKKKGAG